MAYEVEEAPPCITLDGGEREHDYNGEAELAPSVALPAVLRSLDMSRVETRLDFMRELSKALPLNEYNLPEYIYNPAFLDISLLKLADREGAKTQLADMLSNSVTPLKYDHGYPTLVSDMPIWSQLPWETRVAFEAFLIYVQQSGARGIHKIESIEPGLLREWYHENSWSVRAIAYDAYMTAHHARLREKRIFEVQDDHFSKSQRLLTKVTNALEAKTAEHMESLDFDKLIGSFAKLAKVQQEALGIGQTRDGTVNTGSSVEVIMRQTAEKQGKMRTVNADNVDMEALLNDPAALDAAQELIIRVNK